MTSTKTTSERERRNHRWAVLLVIAAATLFAGGCGGGSSRGAGEVGVASGPAGNIELVGHFDQVGVNIHGYGFLSHVAGLDDSSLFSSGGSLFSAVAGATEKQALLTFDFKTSLTNRAVHGPIIDVGQAGAIDFYLDRRPVADFADAASFSKGDRIASAKLAVQDVLNVIAPNRGIATAVGSLIENSTPSFNLGGRTHTLGHRGLEMRVFITGSGKRAVVFPPAAQFDFAGNLTVSGG